jgi:peptidyl-prolyl cis-trans isomerase B (cyclophilin B)
MGKVSNKEKVNRKVVMLKKIMTVVVVAGSVLLPVSAGHAASAGVTCQASSENGHPAPKVKVVNPAKTYHDVTITLVTNCGNITFHGLGKLAPITIQSFISLAKQGFYNNSMCHRLTSAGIYVLQCGDPTAQGTGGPGYTIPDENLPTKNPVNGYPTGTVAMANTGQPHSGGSQFFLIYKGAPGALSPSYTVFGNITAGLNILQYVAAKGSDNSNCAAQGRPANCGDGHPKQKIVIKSVTVVGA